MIRDDIVAEMNEVEMPREYGFHYSDRIPMIRNAISILEIFNKWPDDGGYLDQDAFLIDDMKMWQQLKNRRKLEYKKENKG